MADTSGDKMSYKKDTTTYTDEVIGTTTFNNECQWRTFTRDTLGATDRWDDAGGGEGGYASGAAS